MSLQRRWIRGEFVGVPDGRLGMVRRFDQRSNEVTVQFGATGLMDALQKAMGHGELDDDRLVDEGYVARYHFSKLRLASDAEVARLTGAT